MTRTKVADGRSGLPDESRMFTLHLLGDLCVTRCAERVEVPEGSKRLLSYIALHGREVDRSRTAAVLWPGVDRTRSAGNLRSSLWRLRCAGIDVVSIHDDRLSMHPDVVIDVDCVLAWAEQIVGGGESTMEHAVPASALLALDLLPGWYDDWLVDVRGRIRHRLLDALEQHADILVGRRSGDAIETAMCVIGIDPLRESAQQVLVRAHLAEGNRCEALRSFRTYERILDSELGVRPSVALRRLVLA
jgi:DNA-binding SARP family transcriptional activator